MGQLKLVMVIVCTFLLIGDSAHGQSLQRIKRKIFRGSTEISRAQLGEIIAPYSIPNQLFLESENIIRRAKKVRTTAIGLSIVSLFLLSRNDEDLNLAGAAGVIVSTPLVIWAYSSYRTAGNKLDSAITIYNDIQGFAPQIISQIQIGTANHGIGIVYKF